MSAHAGYVATALPSYPRSAWPIDRLTGNLFIIAALLPWVSFNLNALDSQPWPLIAGIVFLASLRRIKTPNNIKLIGLVLALAIPLATISSYEITSFGVLRAIAGYITIIVSFIAFYNYLSLFGFPYRIFWTIGLLWLIMGVVELYNPALSEFISPTRTTLNRGVTSLAPEPTFFAMFLFFFSWLILSAKNFKMTTADIAMCMANTLAIVILAKSFMVVLYMAICSLVILPIIAIRVFHLGHSSLIKSLCFIIIPALLALLHFQFSIDLTETRLHKGLARYATSSPINAVMIDASINQRLEAIIMSLHGFISNIGAPGGFDTFLEKKEDLSSYWGSTFWYPSDKDKIMSWSGSAVYELGILGGIFIALLFPNCHKRNIGELAIMFVLIFSAIPHGFPLVPMLFALWHFKDSKETMT